MKLVKIYLDSDIWLNFWKGEMIGMIPAFHFTEELLRKAVLERWVVVVSELVKEEVFEKGVSPNDFDEKINELESAGCVIEKAEVTEEDVKFGLELRRERGIHLSDAIHAAIAKRVNAIIVTRNIRHFKLVADIVKVRKPEDLL
jgi:predicted nucleic acid-binding protein